jgi:hypothetical protein
VYPDDLKTWKDDKTFQASCIKPERIQIDGHVEGGDGKPRAKQETFLKSKGLPQANLEDLAAGFVAFYVATGKDMFEDYVVRAAGGSLSFDSYGLDENGVGDAYSKSVVAVASRVPRPSPAGSAFTKASD